MKSCWEQNPIKRPSAIQVGQIFESLWQIEVKKENEKMMNRRINNLNYDMKYLDSRLLFSTSYNTTSITTLSTSPITTITFQSTNNSSSTSTTFTTLPFKVDGDKDITQDFSLLLSQSPIPCWNNEFSPRYTVGIKLQNLRKKILNDPFIIQELSCFIEPNGQADIGSLCTPLYDYVMKELINECIITW